MAERNQMKSEEQDQRWRVFRWLGETMAIPGSWSDPPFAWDEVWEYLPGDVLPMLDWRLRESPDARIPDDIAEQFRLTRTAAVMRGMMIRRAVEAVDDRLDAAGVRSVWLKGVALRSQVYPDPALRPMEDLDVWVSPDALSDAVEAVAGIGYSDDGWVKLAEEASGFAGARLLSESYSRVPLEIHALPSSLRELPSITIQGLWERSVPLQGLRGLALCPGDTLTHLCLHLSRHHRFALGVRPLLDLSLSVSRWKDVIDWSAWCEDVLEAGAAASVWLPMMLSREVFRAEVPESVLESLRPDASAQELLELAKEQFEDTREMPRALEHLVGGGSAVEGAVGSTWRRGIVSLPNKIYHYMMRVRHGQIPLRGWRSVVRLARGRRRLRDSLRDTDSLR